WWACSCHCHDAPRADAARAALPPYAARAAQPSSFNKTVHDAVEPLLEACGARAGASSVWVIPEPGRAYPPHPARAVYMYLATRHAARVSQIPQGVMPRLLLPAAARSGAVTHRPARHGVAEDRRLRTRPIRNLPTRAISSRPGPCYADHLKPRYLRTGRRSPLVTGRGPAPVTERDPTSAPARCSTAGLRADQAIGGGTPCTLRAIVRCVFPREHWRGLAD